MVPKYWYQSSVPTFGKLVWPLIGLSAHSKTLVLERNNYPLDENEHRKVQPIGPPRKTGKFII